MAESPLIPRNRLLTRSDSMRFFSSRGLMSFAYGFTFASIMFTLFLVLNPSVYQISPRLRNSLHASHRYHFSKVLTHNSSFSPPPSNYPHPGTTALETSGQKSLASFVAPRISRKEGSGLAPKGSYHMEVSDHKDVNNPPTTIISTSPQQQESTTSLTPAPCASQKSHMEGSSDNGVNNPSSTTVIELPLQQQESAFTTPAPSGSDQNHVNPPSAIISIPPQREESGSQNVMQAEHWAEVGGTCDLFEGSWVRDDAYPLYSAGSCPYIDEPFDCFLNGRKDNMHEKYRWQPNNCTLPRLNGSDMLELLRGKRLVYVGDSLNRNMWESLLCILRNSVHDKSSIYEVSGREEFRTEGSYSFIFSEYNCSVEFFRSPFLVQEWEIPDEKGSTKETLRLDLVERSCDKYQDADVLIFNTGHWWTHEKRTEGKEYYQEGNYIHGQLSVEEAIYKAMLTWSQWVDANVDPKKTTVFFRGYSPSHFRDGEWNSGGQCENETEPTNNESDLSGITPLMRSIESVIERMKTPVFYLNITKMTDFRVDAHPSMYRFTNMTEETKKDTLTHQDCSHWCLPGVPDLWNELVYSHLLYNKNRHKGNPQQ